MAKKLDLFHTKSFVYEQYFLTMSGCCSRDKAYQWIRCETKQVAGAPEIVRSRKDLV